MIRVRNFFRDYAPWLVLLLVAYWLWGDTAPVAVIEYQHPLFTSTPVRNRDEAKKAEITEAKQGAQVYRYVEWCVLRPIPGEVRKTWTDGIQFQVPSVSTTGTVGCQKRSITETVPPIPGHMVDFQVMTTWKLNPLYMQEVRLNKVPLKVLP